jgi:hypothetical protein
MGICSVWQAAIARTNAAAAPTNAATTPTDAVSKPAEFTPRHFRRGS